MANAVTRRDKFIDVYDGSLDTYYRDTIALDTDADFTFTTATAAAGSHTAAPTLNAGHAWKIVEVNFISAAANTLSFKDSTGTVNGPHAFAANSGAAGDYPVLFGPALAAIIRASGALNISVVYKAVKVG